MGKHATNPIHQDGRSPLLHREQRYTSDMTDGQWEIIRPLLSPETDGPGRPSELDLRQMVNAIFYVARTGCQ